MGYWPKAMWLFDLLSDADLSNWLRTGGEGVSLSFLCSGSSTFNFLKELFF